MDRRLYVGLGSGAQRLDDKTRKEVEELLRKKCPAVGEVDELISQLAAANNFPVAAEDFLQSAEVSTELEQALQFIVDVYRYADGDLTLVTDVVDHHGLANMREVALQYYPLIPAANSLDFKSALFQIEPTAVLLGLFRAGVFHLPEGVHLDEVCAFLDTALTSHNFDILHVSVVELLNDAAVLNAPNSDTRQALDDFIRQLQRLLMIVQYPEDVSLLLAAGFPSAHIVAHTPITTFANMLASHGSSLSSPETLHAQAIAIDLRSEHIWARMQRPADDVAAITPTTETFQGNGFRSAPENFDDSGFGPALTDSSFVETSSDNVDVELPIENPVAAAPESFQSGGFGPGAENFRRVGSVPQHTDDDFPQISVDGVDIPLPRDVSVAAAPAPAPATIPLLTVTLATAPPVTFSPVTAPSVTALPVTAVLAVPAAAPPAPTQKRIEPKEKLLRRSAAAGQVLVDADDITCPDCASVTSPAAYLVDLLFMLKRCPVETTKTSPPVLITLLNRLLARRPDLTNIQLSCDNTNIELPYIDLANEVMESFVRYINDDKTTASITAYNMRSGDTNQSNAATPSNVDLDVYQKYIGRQVTPMNIFPYNFSIDCCRMYLQTLGSSRAEFMSIFQPFHSSKTSSEPNGLDVAIAAEQLGLLNLDFIAITKSSFCSLPQLQKREALNDLKQDDYAKRIGLRTPAQYWGYFREPDVADISQETSQALNASMVDASKGEGLAYITQQLLPRAGITFDELVRILQTPIFQSSVAITPHVLSTDKNKSPTIASKLENFRLVRKDGQPLSTLDCDKLGQFIRLQQKLHWSTEEIYETSAIFGHSSDTGSLIDADHIAHVAAIVKLAKLTSSKTTSLLPLWGLIGTWGGSSLYSQLFLRPWVTMSDPIFLDGANAASWKTVKVSEHIEGVTVALGFSRTDFENIQKFLSIQDEFSLENLSTYHRAVLVCKLFEVPVAQFEPLCKTFGLMNQQLAIDPASFLEALTQWRDLKTKGLDIDMVASALGYNKKPTAASTQRIKTAIDAAFSILDVLKSAKEHNTSNPSKPSDPPSQTAAVAWEQEHVLSKVALDFPSLRVDMLRSLLYGVLTIEGSTKAIDTLRNVTGFDYASANDATEVYLIPRLSDVYRFSFSAGGSSTLNVNNTMLSGSNDGKPLVSMELERGQAYTVKFHSNFKNLQWETDTKPKSIIDAGMLLPTNAVDRVEQVYDRIAKVADVIQQAHLNGKEISFMQTNKLFDCDFNKLTLRAVKGIMTYSELRDSFASSPGSTPLLEFFSWAIQDHTQELTTLSGTIQAHLVSTTKWPEQQVAKLFDANYIGLEASDLIKLFVDEVEIGRLRRQIEALSRFKLQDAPMTAIFTASHPEDPTRPVDENMAMQRANAQLFMRPPMSVTQTKVSDSNPFSDQLRIHRRDALVQYLLQQKYVKDSNIDDADSLFEYFLIDVQMGACLRTSRIKEAISTVQLFVQRCLLGMEAGITSQHVNRDRWNWMQKYRVWEANRKVFLYAENWVDPTLRDNKTEVFKDLEMSMMQTQLNRESITELFKSYIYAVDDISHLDIQAYFQESINRQLTRCHMFARTRTSPFKYYYRTVQYDPSTSAPVPTWTGWELIQLDIPSYEVDERGNTLANSGSFLIPVIWKQQLYLFIPQATLKTFPDPNFEAARDKAEQVPKVVRYWEVKMAWSVYRDGKWSSKQISKSSLSVGAVQITGQTDVFPSVSGLRFPAKVLDLLPSTDVTTKKQQSIAIYVERYIPPDSNAKFVSLGKFTFRGAQLVCVPSPKATTWPGTFATNFEKVITDIGKADEVSAQAVQNKWLTAAVQNPPMLAKMPPVPAPDKDLGHMMTWTISYPTADGVPMGLVVDVEVPDKGTSDTWFCLSSNLTTSVENLGKTNIPFSNLAATNLMESTTTAVDPSGILSAFNGFSAAEQPAIFGQFNSKIFKETTTPYAVYNWELGVHIVSLIGERLLAAQQFDLALEMFRLVFDPTLASSNCWMFPPFQATDTLTSGNVRSMLGGLEASKAVPDTAIAEWAANPFLAHIVARNRPLVYMKRIAMKYIETLIAAGDELFRQPSLEAVPLAIQRYVEASHIFGPAPRTIPAVTKGETKTFQVLEPTLDDFANAATDLELLAPFYIPPSDRKTSDAGSLLGFVRTSYFAIPTNPEIARLRSTIDDRLRKIRSCLDINGLPRRLSLWEPPIDPGLLVRAAASGISASTLLSDLDGPMPNFRFVHLLQKALELCTDLKALGSAYLANKEKSDAEAFVILKSEQEDALHALLSDMKRLQRDEGLRTLDQLQESRKGPLMRFKYYVALTGDNVSLPTPEDEFVDLEQQIPKPTDDDLRISKIESLGIHLADQSTAQNEAATTAEAIAAGLSLIPTISVQAQPMGFGVTITPPAWGSFSSLGASILKTTAQIAGDESAKLEQAARLTQQLQERRFQINSAGREIKVMDKMIEAQKIRNAIIDTDIKIQEQQFAQSKSTSEYLRSKYTNTQLYLWLDNSIQSLHYQTYMLSMDLAKKAERAFQYESGRNETNFIQPTGYWDSSRGGLMSAENLYLSLKRLESAWMTRQNHDFEITKDISLRQLDASALLDLREKGTARFSLPEFLFDLDFPGHYNRRIKFITVSIPCVVGPYTSINCTVRLEKHSYRISPKTSSSAYGSDTEQNDPTIFRQDTVPLQAIALSSAQNDAGVFELDFRNERYLPFEGAGAISTWNIEMPSTFRQFDYNTISDLIFRLHYTSSDGDGDLKTAATASAKKALSDIDTISKHGGLCCFVDLRNDFPREWRELVTGTAPSPKHISLTSMRDRLPFFAKCGTPEAKDVALFVSQPASAGTGTDAQTGNITLVKIGSVTLGSGTKTGQLQSFVTASGDREKLKLGWDKWDLELTVGDTKKLAEQKMFLVFRFTLDIAGDTAAQQ